jgi:hypothetical protein
VILYVLFNNSILKTCWLKNTMSVISYWYSSILCFFAVDMWFVGASNPTNQLHLIPCIDVAWKN